MSRAPLFIACLLPLAAVMLTACGWRLQGDARLPESMREIRVATGDTYSDFYRELRGRLQAAGARMQTFEVRAAAPPPGAEASGAVMTVHSDESGQRVLSVSERNTPEEYEVYYRVEYSLRVDGVELIPRQRVELSRAYSFDSRAVLAKQREQHVLQQALARELVGLVMRRISSVSVTDAVARSAAGSWRGDST